MTVIFITVIPMLAFAGLIIALEWIDRKSEKNKCPNDPSIS
jgi:hypothetical protein